MLGTVAELRRSHEIPIQGIETNRPEIRSTEGAQKAPHDVNDRKALPGTAAPAGDLEDGISEFGSVVLGKVIMRGVVFRGAYLAAIAIAMAGWMWMIVVGLGLVM